MCHQIAITIVINFQTTSVAVATVIEAEIYDAALISYVQGEADI